MSGGSLGYLYNREVPELFECHNLEYMERVEKELIERGYMDIAKDVRRLIEYIKTATIRIGVLAENLNDVFHAVEWTLSSDYGEDDLIEYLEKYRRGEADD